MRARLPKVLGFHRIPRYSPGNAGGLILQDRLWYGNALFPTGDHGVAAPFDYCHIGGIRTRVSLAERIRSFLPDDALETSRASNKEEDDTASPAHLSEDWLPSVSLAAHESEISHAEKLTKSFLFSDTVNYIVSTMPLQVALAVLIERIVPIIKTGPLKDMGVLELGFHLYNQENAGLAEQFLQGVGMEGATQPFEIISLLLARNDKMKDESANMENEGAFQKDSSASDEEKYGASGEHNSRYESGPGTDSRYIDAVITETLNGHHFPQLLSHSVFFGGSQIVVIWFKLRLLALLPWRECEKWLNRYWDHLAGSRSPIDGGSVVALLKLSAASFANVTRWALKTPEFVVPLVSITNTPAQLHSVLRPLLRPAKIPTVTREVAVALLNGAIRLKQSYDIANICHRFEPQLVSGDSHHAYLADALLAVAFAQKRPSHFLDDADVENEEVTCSTPTLQTPLVRMVLPRDSVIANSTVGWAARKLHTRYRQRRVPGRVLWQLLLSIPQEYSLNSYAQSELGKLVAQRPFIEQVRFMALPVITHAGIAQLLKWHITKIVDHRRRNQVGWNTLQAKEDIQLLVAGLTMAAEKAKQHHTEKQSRVLDMVRQLFEQENHGDYSSNGIDRNSILEKLANDDRSISARLAMHVTSKLIIEKNYVVAQQMLRMLGQERLSRLAFDKLLLELANSHPSESYFFVLWLLSENPRAVSYSTMNEILLILINEPSLSESQIMNRFQTLRVLMVNKMRREVSVEPAKSFVNALIESSKRRNGGSRMRLKWALEIAQKAGVSDVEFGHWTRTLKEMNANREGFWYGS